MNFNCLNSTEVFSVGFDRLAAFLRSSRWQSPSGSPSPAWTEPASSSPWLGTAWTSCWTGAWARWWCWGWETTWMRGERRKVAAYGGPAFLRTMRRKVSWINSLNFSGWIKQCLSLLPKCSRPASSGKLADSHSSIVNESDCDCDCDEGRRWSYLNIVWTLTMVLASAM